MNNLENWVRGLMDKFRIIRRNLSLFIRTFLNFRIKIFEFCTLLTTSRHKFLTILPKISQFFGVKFSIFIQFKNLFQFYVSKFNHWIPLKFTEFLMQTSLNHEINHPRQSELNTSCLLYDKNFSLITKSDSFCIFFFLLLSHYSWVCVYTHTRVIY